VKVLIQAGLETVNAEVFAVMTLVYLQLVDHLEECTVIQIHYNIFRQVRISEATFAQATHFVNAQLDQVVGCIAAACLVFQVAAARVLILQAAHFAGDTAVPAA
jgi:hypothetical protein